MSERNILDLDVVRWNRTLTEIKLRPLNIPLTLASIVKSPKNPIWGLKIDFSGSFGSQRAPYVYIYIYIKGSQQDFHMRVDPLYKIQVQKISLTHA